MRFRLAVVAALILCASPIVAERPTRAQDAAALGEARKGAEAGDARSQRVYGQMLLKDTGPRADPKEGIRWLRAAADQGDAIARRDLGNTYLSGNGVPKNTKEAVLWLTKASESGDAISQYALAVLLSDGKTVPKNDEESARWMRAAADQGDPAAQLSLGQSYRNGVGVQKDLLQAYVWVSLAVKARNPKASDAKREIAVALSSEQRREGDRLVAAWGSARVAARAAEASAKATGTGFIVSADGYVITNDHAVRSCKDVRIRRLDESVGVAKLVAQSSDDDLALLKVDMVADSVAPFRSSKELSQGETVIAFGFPLSGALASSGNLASGKLMALVGLSNDERFFQASTALQPGNSGGPLLDTNARIVGITTSIGTQSAGPSPSGAAPQNLNFAIKGDVAAAFLRTHGVVVSATGGLPRAAGAADIGERARHFTVRIECLA